MDPASVMMGNEIVNERVEDDDLDAEDLAYILTQILDVIGIVSAFEAERSGNWIEVTVGTPEMGKRFLISVVEMPQVGEAAAPTEG